MRHHPSGRCCLTVLVAITALAAVPVQAGAAVTTFANATPITLTDNAAAASYPSVITASRLCGTVSNVVVTLAGLTHGATKDLDVMLVAPSGTKVMLLSDAGGNASNVTLAFADEYASVVPASSIASGNFKPWNYADVAGTGNDTFPAGPPAGAAPATLGATTGTAPNGAWRLFIRDDHVGSAGSLARGWSLRLLTPNCPVPTPDPGGFDPGFDDGEGGLDPEEGGGSPDTGSTRPRLPALTGLTLSSPRFRARKRGGTKVSFKLSRAASLVFTVDRRARGRKAGRRCVPRTRSNRGKKACTRWVRVKGSIKVEGRAGPNSFKFNGTLGGRKLAPGAYRMNGNAAAVSHRAFTVVR